MKTPVKILFLLLLTFSFRSHAADSTAIKVESVWNVTREKSENILLGDMIGIKVSNIDSLLALQSDTGHLLLYMNGLPMTGIVANYYDESTGSVYFCIDRTDGQTDPWDVFYVSPARKFWERPVHISLGYFNLGPVETDKKVKTFSLVIIRTGYFWLSVICIVIIFFLYFFATRSGLLKDDSKLKADKKPYSLSRTQLAYWTLIVAVAYLFIALVTGELAPLSTSTLILLGISGLTTTVASNIDNSDKRNGRIRTQDDDPSEGFYTDLISDTNGVSVTRFQMVIFNLILGVFFVIEVFTKLKMPDFDNNLLILMGISNGTYTSLKAGENKTGNTTTAASVTQAAAPAADDDTEDVLPVG